MWNNESKSENAECAFESYENPIQSGVVAAAAQKAWIQILDFDSLAVWTMKLIKLSLPQFYHSQWEY